MRVLREWWFTISFIVPLLLRGRRLMYGTNIFILCVRAATGVARAWFIALVVNAVVGGNQSALWQSLGALSIFLFVEGVINAATEYVDTRLMNEIDIDLKNALIEKNISVDLGAYDDPEFQELYHFVDNNLHRVQIFARRIPDIIECVAGSLFSLLAMWQFGWWVCLVGIVFSLPKVAIESWFAAHTFSIWGGDSTAQRRYQIMQNTLRNRDSLMELLLTGNAIPLFHKIKLFYWQFYMKFRNLRRWRAVGNAIANMIPSIGIAISLVYFFLFSNRAISAGDVSFFIITFLGLTTDLRNTFTRFTLQLDDMKYARKAMDFLRYMSHISPEAGEVLVHESHAPTIEFRDVSFRYHETGDMAIHHASFSIPAGARVAIVGPNGAGKSTLVKLICRFYDPTHGVIMAGGQDIRQYSQRSWQDMMSVVFQSYPRYRLSAQEAITMSNLADPIDVVSLNNAAQVSESSSFISKWVDGYQQMLDPSFPGGVEPSVGQWQKLAIARALYRDAPILILDEPTASVDAESEQKIFESLERLPRTKTVILISHRFSTVRNADVILVVDGGTIAEQGTHNELMKLDGTYARLFNLQAKGYEQQKNEEVTL